MEFSKFLKQSNKLTEAKYHITTLEKDVLYMVMGQVRKGDPANTRYFISISDLRHESGRPNLKICEVEKVIDRLQTRIAHLVNKKGDIVKVQWIGAAIYRKGTGTIEIEIHETLRPYFFDLGKLYTKFEFEMAVRMRSGYSKRMYEMAAQWINMDMVPQMQIDELKERLGVIKDDGKDTYPDWSIFNKRVLIPAQKELDKYSDINLTYRPVKQGKRYEYILFDVERKPMQTSMAFKDVNSRLMTRLTHESKLASHQAAQVIKKFSVDEINGHLYQASLKRDEIENMGGYMARIFNV